MAFYSVAEEMLIGILVSKIGAILPVLAADDTPREIYCGLSLFLDRHLALRHVIRDLFIQDLDTFPDSLLLREETHCTRIVAGFLQNFATPMLRRFFRREMAFIESKKGLKLMDGNQQIELFRRLVGKLLDMKKKMPLAAMKMVLLLSRTLSEVRGIHLGGSFRKITCSLLFLRFICPFLVSQVSRLVPAPDVDTESNIRAGYLEVVKMVQCLASETQLEQAAPNSCVLNHELHKRQKVFNATLDELYQAVGPLVLEGQLSSPPGSLSRPASRSPLSSKKALNLSRAFFTFVLEKAPAISLVLEPHTKDVFLESVAIIPAALESPHKTLTLMGLYESR